MLARTALAAITRSPAAFLRSSWPWRSLAYLLCSAVHAVAACMVIYAAYAYGAGLATFAALLAVAVLTPPAAAFERWRLRLVDRAPAGDPHLKPPRPGPRAWLATRLREQVTWRELGFTVVAVSVLWLMDIGLVSSALWLPLLLMSAPFQPGMRPLDGLPLFAVGLLMFPLFAYLAAAWAGTRALLTRAVLAPGDAEIIRSRARLVDAFEAERRRIERDLHDGAQQRLVSLSMKLGLARLDLPPGSPAEAQLAEAHEEAKRALAELRELIRGVHPQVLTDRGLGAAVREVAGRSPVPVDVDVALPGRLPPSIEATAYYVVSEAMANIAKHSRARRGFVYGRLQDGALVVEIGDDGVGGADPAGGSGLAGLADRVAVTDGEMTLSSPPGGPTTLRVEIPCPVSE
ncbi:histidine kinase [Sphaerisporangium melleum]|uniref:histidine kinase n=1 Tax=Sphaerisporangium melleum TaxID=321316 RepID=A0A917VH71_9ACTN|nr:sensor histidine kinase [Sphaerisporangium melleum]GGK81401.1 histidine kinase [Sphaerisporangium melleum]GII73853.1 histidine kinase [Sphaerisporangium melleum]